jgi:uncharacterized membrane protein
MSLLIIIFFEILFLLFNDNEIFKEHIDYIYSSEGDKTIKKITIAILLLLCFLLYHFVNLIGKKFRINKIIFTVFVIVSLIIFIEYKLSSNVTFSNTESVHI